MQFKTIKSAEEYIGGISTTSKMPCPSYGISAAQCITGERLAKIPGTICFTCYAKKGMYGDWNKNVSTAHARRLATLERPLWADAFIFLINRKGLKYFRWHDSGDLQSFQHLLNIVRIAEGCPDTRFWLPTREKKFVRMYQQSFGDFPKNLVVRISAVSVDSPPSENFPLTSTVHKDKKPIGFRCKAPSQSGECRDCRACWDPKVKNVSYNHH